MSGWRIAIDLGTGRILSQGFIKMMPHVPDPTSPFEAVLSGGANLLLPRFVDQCLVRPTDSEMGQVRLREAT